MFNLCFTCNSVKHLNKKSMENIYKFINILDKNAVMQPFYTGQVTGYKIIFDCILTNSALKYLYDICEMQNLNLRLYTDNKFNLLIY